jgi:hypothetical protein
MLLIYRGFLEWESWLFRSGPRRPRIPVQCCGISGALRFFRNPKASHRNARNGGLTPIGFCSPLLNKVTESRWGILDWATLLLKQIAGK